MKRLTPFWFLVTVFTLVVTLRSFASPLEFYVSTNGNDRWTGRLKNPNRDRSDGPLATLDGARAAIRLAGAALDSRPFSGATVWVRGGNYVLDKPFVLEPGDSGSSDAPVVYRAYKDEKPIFSGGTRIEGFHTNGMLWQIALPAVQSGEWYFRELFVNGARRQRARSPNSGYFRIAALVPGPMDAASKRAVMRDRFNFAPGDLRPFQRLNDVELTLMHSWETSIHPLKSIDTNSNLVEFAAPLKEWWSIGYWEKAQRYFIENAFEALDQPGEWYLDRASGVLSYWPLPGERIGSTEIVAPRLGEFVVFAGNAESNRFVSHVTLRGLAFHHADWRLNPKGNSSTQAAVEVPATITADGALNCVIEKCEVAHTGTYGIWFRRGCKDCHIQQNRLFDLGAGGIRVGEDRMAKTDAAETSRTLVDNNHVHDGGKVYPGCVGIWLAQASHNRISHNDIHDLAYTGISVGWNWNDSTNRTHDNVIEWNHVHDLGHGMLSDCGLIYCLGVSLRSVIRNNVFHDIWPYSNPSFGWGIYFDATCGNYRCESNLVYNTQSGGVFWNNGGHEHVIRNNIFALGKDYAVWPYWEKRPVTFTHNVVYLESGKVFVSHAGRTLNERRLSNGSLGDWSGNLYWSATGTNDVRFFDKTFPEWQATGLDTSSMVANPKFVSAAKHDFRLRRGSPALRLGFHQLDLDKAGLYGERSWRNECRHENCPADH